MAKKNKAWVISADMGYGHQRAAYPLKDIAYDRIINSNSDKIVTAKERIKWFRFRAIYEGLSRIRSFPILGELLWKLYDSMQSISPYYPFRDLSKPNFGSLYMHSLIKKGFLSSVVDYTKSKKIPIVSTFFAPALAAAHENIKDVYCVVTDTDINRVWVPEDPKKEKIFYLTPTRESANRLKEYGVSENKIFFTGFPLPKENTGPKLSILKRDIGLRLPNLDPKKVYISQYKSFVKKQLGSYYKSKSDHPLTITYAVGGAGAQKELGASILRSLEKKLRKQEIRLNLIAGTRPHVRQYFIKVVEEIKLAKLIGKSVRITCQLDKKSFFQEFNELLHTTDILWTKPSELSFYTALGLPIIIAPPLGSHEILNKKWLMMVGGGHPQENPAYVDEWLFDWINSGVLAEAVMDGFMETPKYGTYNIEKLIFSKKKEKVKLKY